MKDRFRQRRICPDFRVARIRRAHVLFDSVNFYEPLVVISHPPQTASKNLFCFARQVGKSTFQTRVLSRLASPFDMDGEQFRQEFCGQFAEPELKPDCPKCADGNVTMDLHGRGFSCRSCGYKSWERVPVYFGFDTSKGKDYTAAVFSHIEGPVLVVDKVVTSKAAPEARP